MGGGEGFSTVLYVPRWTDLESSNFRSLVVDFYLMISPIS